MDSPTVQGDRAVGLPPHYVPSLIPPEKRKFKRRGGRGRHNRAAHIAAPLLTVAGSEPENPDLLPVQQQHQVPSAASSHSVPTAPVAPGGLGTRPTIFEQDKHSRSDLRLMASMLENCVFDLPPAAYSNLARRYTLTAMGQALPGEEKPTHKFQMAAARLVLAMHSRNWQMATVSVGKQELHLHAHQHAVVTDTDERSAALAAIVAELAKRDALDRGRTVEAGIVDQHDGG